MFNHCITRTFIKPVFIQVFRFHSTKLVKMEVKRSQPKWNLPNGDYVTGLKLNNSLTRNKELFIPKEGRKVSWYSCGPTVYDDSHMGHARSYISFDIMRRIMTDYFHYDIKYVMNITDIDDKIIRRARRTYLYEEYIGRVVEREVVMVDLKAAMQLLQSKIDQETDTDKLTMMHKSMKAVTQTYNNQLLTTQELLSSGVIADVLSDWLDEEKGGSVVDNDIFQVLPRLYEDKFHQDMKHLNVREADVVTRVSEFIPQIVEYVQEIIKKEYAYDSNGSVYFNTSAFDNHNHHHYAKLVPEACGDAKALEEGEGSLSVSKERLTEKRNTTDFALWKKSKQGEPSWESPWGMGRPGWHIECSVMASCVLGASLDVHTGGIDLKFPHHDNELAQSEAYYDNDDWVTYFLHSGHLTIEGCKMSKSLKNFITIQQALHKYSSRHLRLLFLMHGWDQPLDYSESTMKVATVLEKSFNEFFMTVKDLLRQKDDGDDDDAKEVTSAGQELQRRFAECKQAVHKALCDNLNTKTSLDAMRKLIGHCNLIFKLPHPPKTTLRNIASYLTAMLKVFGAVDDCVRGQENQKELEEVLLPYLQAFSDFRDSVRSEAGKIEDKELAGVILRLCDEVRDGVLVRMGVSVEDKEDKEGGSVVKLLRVDVMRREVEEKDKKEKELRSQYEATRSQKKDKLNAWKVTPAEASNQERHNAHFDMISDDVDSDTLGFPVQGIPNSLEEVILPYLEAFSEFRDSVRSEARKNKAVALLRLCDEVRDGVLVGMGVSVEDKEGGGKAVVKLLGVDVMRREVEEKEQQLRMKQALKEEKLAQQKAKMEAYKTPPSQMFKLQCSLYSAFDDQGLPTHDETGAVLTKSQIKKLQKAYDAQAKKHNDYLKSLKQCV